MKTAEMCSLAILVQWTIYNKYLTWNLFTMHFISIKKK